MTGRKDDEFWDFIGVDFVQGVFELDEICVACFEQREAFGLVLKLIFPKIKRARGGQKSETGDELLFQKNRANLSRRLLVWKGCQDDFRLSHA